MSNPYWEPTELELEEEMVEVPPEASLEMLLSSAGLERPWTSDELLEADVSVRYLVDGVLADTRSCVIGGAYKTLKTSVGIDLVISLAGPRKFLGSFSVPEQKRCLMFSAESGKGAIKDTAIRVAGSKGLLLKGLPVFWGWWVPRAKTEAHLRILRELIDHHRIDVVVIDPLYLSITGEIQSNLSLAGEQIAALAMECQNLGSTVICIDHIKRSSVNAREYQPLELGDVTGAGKAEFFRQWLLIGRREKFDPANMLHRLWLTVGGNDGHAGQYALDIDERKNEYGERQWSIGLGSASEAFNDAHERQEEAREEKKRRTEQRREHKLRKAYVDHPDGLTSAEAYAMAGLSAGVGRTARNNLIDAGFLESCKVNKGNREYDGFKCVRKPQPEKSDNSDNSDNLLELSGCPTES